MKDIILVIVLLITVGLAVLAVRFHEKADKASKNLDEERYSRMVAEETLQKNSAKLTTLFSQLKDEKQRMAKIEDILDQEKSVNTDLKKQYDELAQSKSDLEAKLQAAQQVLAAQQALAAQAASQSASTQGAAAAGQSAGAGH
jgi:septal ring factor EnvC (AmiA/AmiB activator)